MGVRQAAGAGAIDMSPLPERLSTVLRQALASDRNEAAVSTRFVEALKTAL
jgi:hypothetical protein